jgi:hypothetical protein
MSVYYAFVRKYITLFRYPNWPDRSMGLQPYRGSQIDKIKVKAKNTAKLATKRKVTKDASPRATQRARRLSGGNVDRTPRDMLEALVIATGASPSPVLSKVKKGLLWHWEALSSIIYRRMWQQLQKNETMMQQLQTQGWTRVGGPCDPKWSLATFIREGPKLGSVGFVTLPDRATRSPHKWRAYGPNGP